MRQTAIHQAYRACRVLQLVSLLTGFYTFL